MPRNAAAGKREEQMEQAATDIEAMIREEKRLTAVESHCEAWAETVSAGIEPEIIAEAALATALAELVRSRGEDAALTLLDKMRDRTRAGEFEPFLHVH